MLIRSRSSCRALLVLLLGLWCTPAGGSIAGPVVAVHADELTSANARDMPELARAGHRLQLVPRPERKVSDGARPPGPIHLSPPVDELPAAALQQRFTTAPRSEDPAVSPLCERLPYYATAPPMAP